MSQRALQAFIAAAALVSRKDALGAEALGVLAVAPPPGPDAGLIELTLQLGQQVAGDGADALDARQLRERMTGPAAGPALAELERASEAARLAYLNGEYERSVGMLRSIAGDLERLPDRAEVFDLWTKVMTRLARTELDLGRTEPARATIERVLRAAPDLAVARSLYPARLVEEVERARAALRAAPTGSLVVAASVPGARVYVNGREVGTAPVHLVLARGRYDVSGATESARVRPSLVEVGDEGREILLDFTIAEALRPALGPGLALPAGDRSAGIVAAGGHLGLHRVLAVSIAAERGASYLVGSLYDVRRGVLEREGRVRLSSGMLPPGGNVALAEFLVTGRATSRLVEVPGEPRAAALARVPTPVAPPPPAASIPANEARPRVSFGVRLGYSKALGDVEGNTNMDEWIASQVPLQVDALVRLGRRLSLGVYGSYGFGRGGADVSAICGRAGATCLLQIFRAGVQAEVEFTPGALTPWMAAGIGYEWNAFHTEDGTLTGAADVMYRGIELLNVQGGAEWRLAPGFSCGPFLMASMGWYDRGSVRGTGAPGTGRIGEETIHTWAEVGIRSRFGF